MPTVAFPYPKKLDTSSTQNHPKIGCGTDWAPRELQRVGLRLTRGRIGLLEIMAQHQGHYLRPEEVVRNWLKVDNITSVSMVYRVLAQLADVGLLRRGITPEGKVAYTLPEAYPHKSIPLHLPDGRMIELQDSELLTRIQQSALLAGVDVSTLKLAVYGLK